MKKSIIVFLGWTLFFCAFSKTYAEDQRKRAEQIGVHVGKLPSGPLNMITDVKGVKVGHLTRIEADHIRTGVTAILPHGGNIFQYKVPGGIYNFNSFGKLAGSLQVDELGNIESPIILTNTLSVGTAVEATASWVLSQEGNEHVRSVNALVGETNDGFLNDIRGQHITASDVINAIEAASGGIVEEGSAGAGTGTRSFGYKSGIGTASRLTDPIFEHQYTVGVLVQSNFGNDLYINGVPFTREMKHLEASRSTINPKRDIEQQRQNSFQENPEKEYEGDGSAMIIIATDAPLTSRNLRRMAKRSFMGMARTAGFMSNYSGDFAIAFSTAYTISSGEMRFAESLPALIGNDEMNPLFQAVEEATREAIYNALFMSDDMTGHNGNRMNAIPLEKVIEILDRYNMRYLNDRFSNESGD